MTKHEYTPSEALNQLLRSVGERSKDLAERMRIAIDVGKDVQIEDPGEQEGRTRRKKPRYYRKNQPLTDVEALHAALGVLRAHLLEFRMFVDSASKEFFEAVIDEIPPQSSGRQTHQAGRFGGKASPKVIEIDSEPETARATGRTAPLALNAAPSDQLQSLLALFARLDDLTDFGGAPHGHAR